MRFRSRWLRGPSSLFDTFMGCMDLKTGVTVILLFTFLNKVAGVYGLITLATGGSPAQLSLYFYSIVGMIAIWWGLKAVYQEHAKYTRYVAYGFLLDHVFSTAWIAYFAVVWWYYTPHDGRREAHSAAQEELMGSVGGHSMTPEDRAIAAQAIWHQEKGSAVAVLVLGWIIKCYFAAIIFSYAISLQKGTYRSLSQNPSSTTALPHPSLNLEEEDYELAAGDEFYRPQPRRDRSGPSRAPPQARGPGVKRDQYGGRGREEEVREPDEVLFDENFEEEEDDVGYGRS